MKVDKRHNYYLVLDTETLNGIKLDDGGIDLTQSLVYDFGWAIVDSHGRIYQERSFVVKETFLGMKDAMQSAYYANKIPHYWEEIKSGKRALASWYQIKVLFDTDCKDYPIKAISAHNASFDHRAILNTQRYLTKSKYRFYFPYNVEIIDTLKISKQVMGEMESYKKFCADNGYMTKHKTPRVKLTAEILYRFISNDNEFKEAHTGLEDVKIETKILAYCLRRKKKDTVMGLWEKIPPKKKMSKADFLRQW